MHAAYQSEVSPIPFNITTKNAAVTAIAADITYLGVHTLVDPGTSTTANAGEATGGSPAYARVLVPWSAASGSQVANSSALSLNVPTGTYGFLTFWNAATGNTANYMGYAPMGGSSAIKGFAVTDPTFTNLDYFCDGHGLSNTNTVFVYPEFGGSLPTGLAAGTIYYVVNSATNTFQLSATSGGTGITVSSAVGFFWQRIVSETFNAQGSITVAIGALIIDGTTI